MKREIKKEHIRQAFIHAAKEIIETSGIENVSARNVGKIAGYSYATIYNYYQDINDLLAETAVDYLDGSYEYMIQFVQPGMTVVEKLKSLARGYITYLYNNPELFRVIFIHNFGERTVEQAMKLLPRVVLEIRATLEQVPKEQLIGSVDDVFKLMSSAAHGKLMFVLLGRDNISLEQLLQSTYIEIDMLTGGPS